jgi:hypothetical protein
MHNGRYFLAKETYFERELLAALSFEGTGEHE